MIRCALDKRAAERHQLAREAPATDADVVVCRACGRHEAVELIGAGAERAWRVERNKATGVMTLRGPHGLVLRVEVDNRPAKAALEWLAAIARSEWPGEETP